MRAGDLDRRVRIQVRVRSQSATGEEVSSWEEVPTAAADNAVWMGKRDMRATERWASEQTVAEIMSVFTAHWAPAFDLIQPDTHRLIYRDRVYEIHGIREIGRREGVEIAAAARAEAAFG